MNREVPCAGALWIARRELRAYLTIPWSYGVAGASCC